MNLVAFSFHVSVFPGLVSTANKLLAVAKSLTINTLIALLQARLHKHLLEQCRWKARDVADEGDTISRLATCKGTLLHDEQPRREDGTGPRNPIVTSSERWPFKTIQQCTYDKRPEVSDFVLF